jgi:hypothetical protein
MVWEVAGDAPVIREKTGDRRSATVSPASLLEAATARLLRPVRRWSQPKPQTLLRVLMSLFVRATAAP